jgi:hypothetical protein
MVATIKLCDETSLTRATYMLNFVSIPQKKHHYMQDIRQQLADAPASKYNAELLFKKSLTDGGDILPHPEPPRVRLDSADIVAARDRQHAFFNKIGTAPNGMPSVKGVVRIMTQNMHARPINRYQPSEELSEIGSEEVKSAAKTGDLGSLFGAYIFGALATRKGIAAGQSIKASALPTCDSSYNFDNGQVERGTNFAELLRTRAAGTWHPQIICFQELQEDTYDIVDAILTAPMDDEFVTVPYQTALCSGGGRRPGYEGTCLPKQLKRGALVPGGIHTYSVWPIVKQVDMSFEGGPGPDSVVNKGAVYSKIQAKWGDKETNIHVINMHPSAPITDKTQGLFGAPGVLGKVRGGCVNGSMNCSIFMMRASAIKQLRMVLAFKESLGIPQDESVFFAGDMNINRYTALWETEDQEKPPIASVASGEEFNRLLTELMAEQPPLYANPQPTRGVGNGHGGVFTWDGSENAITVNPLWPESYTWIDYVLFSTQNAAPLYMDNSVCRTYLEGERIVNEKGDFYKIECRKWREAQKKRIRALLSSEGQGRTSDSVKAEIASRLTPFVSLAESKFAILSAKGMTSIASATEMKAKLTADEMREITRIDMQIAKLQAAKPAIEEMEMLKRILVYEEERRRLGFGDADERGLADFHDVSDHYGVLSTIMVKGVNEVANRKLMSERIKFDETDDFTGFPKQHYIVGYDPKSNVQLPFANRHFLGWGEFRSRELWERQVAGVGLPNGGPSTFREAITRYPLTLRLTARKWFSELDASQAARFFAFIDYQRAVGMAKLNNPIAFVPTYNVIDPKLVAVVPEVNYATAATVRMIREEEEKGGGVMSPTPSARQRRVATVVAGPAVATPITQSTRRRRSDSVKRAMRGSPRQ